MKYPGDYKIIKGLPHLELSKVMEEEEKEHKVIPINPDKFDEILIGIGRRKKQNPKEIKEEKIK
jgi:hypothetical protein